MTIKAKVIADFGKAYLIEDENLKVYKAQARGKKVDYACGDWVEVTLLNDEQAVIESCYPRANILYRSNIFKSKTLATNIDQVFFIASIEPVLNENLLQRALLATEASNIDITIVLNKIDLAKSEVLKTKLSFYQSLGYKCESIAAIEDISVLKPLLKDKTSILMGQSGVGKSTIVNQLLEHSAAKVNAISSTLHTGKHTTTHTYMYRLKDGGFIVDSPGLQKFGLSYIEVGQLANYFPEFKSYLGHCRFYNCTHQEEPGCAIKQAVLEHKVEAFRLEFLQEITKENFIKKY